ncbi:MAG TPA: hypothetical protein VF808_07965 [Ktedonobacterales bacterium]
MDRMKRATALGAPAGAMATQLTGRQVTAARLAWLLAVGATLGVFAWNMRDFFDMAQRPSMINAALSPAAAAALLRAGITLSAYAWISFVVVMLVTAVSLALALILFWRRGDDWMALLVSAFILNYTTTEIGIPTNPTTIEGWSLGAALTIFWSTFSFALPFGVLLVFPSGRFAPRWSLWFLVAAILWGGVFRADSNLLGGALVLGYPLFIGGVIGIMVYRYRRVSSSLERLQTKWVTVALVVTLIANQAFWFPTAFTPLGQTIYPPLAYLAYELVLGLLPVIFFIAIQRYQLYNIDTIINRALVYGSLTFILAALYFGLVIGAQTLIRLLTGQTDQSQLVIVLSTLLIAALVQPLRRGLQRQIDRRFYRSRYDAARTLQTFGATLRGEVELDDLSAHLVAVVEETMRPASVTLWLRTGPVGSAYDASERRK